MGVRRWRAAQIGRYLALSADAEVRVGKLGYSLDCAAERLSVTSVELLGIEVNAICGR